MITLHNKQRKIKVDTNVLNSKAQRILSLLGYGDFDIGILLASSAKMCEYNRVYRGKDRVTNILSFSYHPNLVAGKQIKVINEEDKNLGDLILCPEYIAKEAEDLGRSFDEHLTILLVHGIVHLLGYDHETDVEWRSMRAKEVSILKKLAAH